MAFLLSKPQGRHTLSLYITREYGHIVTRPRGRDALSAYNTGYDEGLDPRTATVSKCTDALH